MRPMILFLALIAVLFLLGFALHTLVWVALVALVRLARGVDGPAAWPRPPLVQPVSKVRRLAAPRSSARRGEEDPRNHPNRGAGGTS